MREKERAVQLQYLHAAFAHWYRQSGRWGILLKISTLFSDQSGVTRLPPPAVGKCKILTRYPNNIFPLERFSTSGVLPIYLKKT